MEHGPSIGAATLARRTALVALAAATTLLVASSLRPLVPWPNGYGMRDKFAYFAEHKDEFDLVYVGSSTVYRSFRPTVIDAELAAHGRPVRSYNFGAGGMSAMDVDRLVDEILALEPARLRWLVVEWLPWQAAADDLRNAQTRRAARAHSPRATWAALRMLARVPGAAPVERLSTALTHLGLLARHLVLFAEGRFAAAEQLGVGDAVLLTRERLDAERGYRPLEAHGNPSIEERYDALRADPDAYLERVARLVAGLDAAVDLAQIDLAVIEERYARIRAAGIEPIVVIPPTIVARPLAHRLAEAGRLPTLLAFDDPREYPALYELRARFDANHLGGEGADLFSREFARAFAARLEVPDGG